MGGCKEIKKIIIPLKCEKKRKKKSCLVEYIKLLKFYFERLVNFHAVLRNCMYIDFPGGVSGNEPT